MPSHNSHVALSHTTTDPAPGLPCAGPSTSNAAPKPCAEPDEADLDDIESRPRTGFLGKAREIVLNNTGLLLVIGAQMFFSLMNTLVKKLNSINPPVSALELIAVRMGITYICSIVYMLNANIPDPFLGPKGVRLLLVFRGFAGFFSLFGVYYSLEYLSLSDATVLIFLAPICTALAGALFLKERFALKEAIAGVCSLFGVILIARPVFIFGKASHNDTLEKGTPEQRLVAVGVALIGVLGATGAYTSLRAIGKRAYPLHSLVSYSTQCVIVAVVGMFVTRSPVVIPTRLDWLIMLIMIGIFGFVAQVLLTMGLQRETAGRGSMAIYTQIVFATILERVVFQTTPSALSMLGTMIIITAALCTALTKDSDHKTKHKSNAVHPLDVSDEGLEEGLLACPNPEDIQENDGVKHYAHSAGDTKAGLKNEDGNNVEAKKFGRGFQEAL